MTFPKDLLAEHETLVFERRPHWIALAAPVMWIVLFTAFWIVGYKLAADHIDKESTRSLAQNVVAIIALLGWLILGVVPAMRWYYTMFVLTSDRLITRKGIIAKRSKEIPLERINDVSFTQSIIERALGAGNLVVESAGEHGQEVISDVRHPEQVQLAIYKEAEENQNRMMRGGGAGQAPAQAAAPSVTDQLESLARLKDQGVITEAEFQNKKAELLKRL
jgi:uncharacterized membrane protein YdbT with pleckstrin-like domain